MQLPSFLNIVGTVNMVLDRTDLHCAKRPGGLIAMVPKNVAPPSPAELQTLHSELQKLAPNASLNVAMSNEDAGIAIAVHFDA